MEGIVWVLESASVIQASQEPTALKVKDAQPAVHNVGDVMYRACVVCVSRRMKKAMCMSRMAGSCFSLP